MQDKPPASDMKTVHHDVVGYSICSAFGQLPINSCVLEDCTAISISPRRSEQKEFIEVVINRVFGLFFFLLITNYRRWCCRCYSTTRCVDYSLSCYRRFLF